MSRKGVQLRQVVLGAIGGAAVTAAAWALALGVVEGINAMFPSEDANIGLGLLGLAIPAVVIPLGLWALMRRLDVPGAVLIAAGAIVVHVATIGAGGDSFLAMAALATGVFTGYSAVAAAVAGAINGRLAAA